MEVLDQSVNNKNQQPQQTYQQLIYRQQQVNSQIIAQDQQHQQIQKGQRQQLQLTEQIPVCFIHVQNNASVQLKENKGQSQYIQIHAEKKLQNIQQRKKLQIKKQQKECRICLETESQGKIIQPCICTGSMSYAHQKCLIQWIKRKLDPRVRKTIKCQVCNIDYKYKLNKNSELSLDQLKYNSLKFQSTFRTFYCIMTLLLIGLVGLILLLIIGSVSGGVGDKVRQVIITSNYTKLIISSACFIYFNFLLFITIIFVIQYGVVTEIQIKRVFDINQIKKPRNFRIFPKFK